MTTSILELDHVTTEFVSGWGRGRSVLTAMSEVSLSVAPGETLGLVGESGSGKSTTAAVALGLRTPTSGEVRFLGKPFGRRKERLGLIQAVPQNPFWSLDPRLPVALSVAEPLAVRGGGEGDLGVAGALRRLVLAELVGDPPEVGGPPQARAHQLVLGEEGGETAEGTTVAGHLDPVRVADGAERVPPHGALQVDVQVGFRQAQEVAHPPNGTAPPSRLTTQYPPRPPRAAPASARALRWGGCSGRRRGGRRGRRL